MLSTILFCASLASVVTAQIPIPHRNNDISVGNANAPIVLDAFLDLTCSDCLAAHPTLQAVVDHYGPEILRFNIIPFPLPYHDNAFTAAQAAFAIQKTSPDKVMDWINLAFDKQYLLLNTFDGTKQEMIQRIATLISDAKIMDQATFLSNFNDPNVNSVTRTAWKVSNNYVCLTLILCSLQFYVPYFFILVRMLIGGFRNPDVSSKWCSC